MFSSSRALTNTNSSLSSDPYFNYVLLLLHGDSTNGNTNTSITDSSAWATIPYYYPSGFTGLGSPNPYNPQGYMIYFNGTTDYLTLPYNTSYYDWWTGNYTIEAWIWPYTFTGWYDSSTTTIPTLIGNMSATASSNYWSFGINSTGQVQFQYYNGSNQYVNSTNTVNLGKWNHIAMTCDGTNIYLFVNGVGTTATAISGTPQSSTSYTLTIGSYYNVTHTTNYIKGHVRDLRIVKGTAVYSGTTYTQPAAPLTNITNTTLLLNQNNWTDASIYDVTVTVTGSPWIYSGGPYTGLLAYNPNTHMGSSYTPATAVSASIKYGASGAARTSALNLSIGSSDFTVEGWFYPQGTSINNITGNATGLFSIGVSPAILTISWNQGGQIQISGPTIITYSSSIRNCYNQSWNHIAYTRTGGIGRFFVNGKLIATTNDQQTYTMPVNISGINTVSGVYFYVSNFRVVKNTAAYITNFTPPRGAVGADNTQLYNYTSEIWYAAQFSGSNYLSWTNSNTSTLDTTAGFCVEFWFYASTAINTVGFWTNIFGSGTNNLALSINTTQVQLSNGGYYSITASLPFTIQASGMWYHMALIGANGSNYFAVDGVVVNFNDAGGSGGYTHNGIWNYTNSIGSASSWQGYIRDFRINIGTSVYGTSNFARPTLPLTVLSTTQILTCANSTLIDQSRKSTSLTNNSSVTFVSWLGSSSSIFAYDFWNINGNTIVLANCNTAGIYDSTGKNFLTIGASFIQAGNGTFQISTAQSKFGGSSIYSGGTTSYHLRIQNSALWDFGSSDFIIEFWVYFNVVSSAQTVISKKTSGTGFGPFQINVSASNQITFNISTNGTSYSTSTVTGVTIAATTWYYVACWRAGNVAYASVNGTIGSAISGLSTTAVISNTADVTIGVTSYASGTQALNGYLDDLRVTVGTARGYTTSAPATPTAAFPNQ